MHSDALLDQFLDLASLEFNQSLSPPLPLLEWTQGISLPHGGKFTLEGHVYQRDLLTEEHPRQVYKKAAQMGLTEVSILKTMHGLLFGRYPQGVLYLLPSVADVTDFSRGRFGPFLAENPEIGKEVSDTDAISIKRVRKAMLYLRGARATSKIEGFKRTSSQLKSVPVDRICYDELDEMDPNMVDLARERLSHSLVKEELYLSTPSIPDFGIDKLYTESDQRVWMIRCQKCQTETCLEVEFPSCLLELPDGQVIRACKKCKAEVFPKDGHWVPLYPERSKDLVGWWISQLNSAFVSPGSILKTYNDPPNHNLMEVYNSKLGMAFISAENRLTLPDVYACCGQEAMATKNQGPCAMGVDIGSMLHVVVGCRPTEKALQVLYLARVSSFNDVHDIARRFNVRSAVLDMEPELRQARAFQQTEPYSVFLCDYQDSLTTGTKWDELTKLIKVNRTEICDETHHLVATPGRLILPRRCEEVDQFARELSNIAKVLQEDLETGSREYRYRKTGEDHYRHALNYLTLAALKVPLSDNTPWWARRDQRVKVRTGLARLDEKIERMRGY